MTHTHANSAARGDAGRPARAPARASSPGPYATAGNRAVASLLEPRAIQRDPANPYADFFGVLRGDVFHPQAETGGNVVDAAMGGARAAAAAAPAPSEPLRAPSADDPMVHSLRMMSGVEQAHDAVSPIVGGLQDVAHGLPGLGGLVPQSGPQAQWHDPMLDTAADALAMRDDLGPAVGVARSAGRAAQGFAHAIPGLGELVPAPSGSSSAPRPPQPAPPHAGPIVTEPSIFGGTTGALDSLGDRLRRQPHIEDLEADMLHGAAVAGEQVTSVAQDLLPF